MKKIIGSIIIGLVATMAHAAVEVDDSYLNTQLAYSESFDFPASNDNANRIGAIVTYTSATPSAFTFTDGRTSSGSITVASTVALSGVYVTIGSYKFCAGVSAIACPKSDTTYFFAVGASVNATATNLATKIDAVKATTGVGASASSAVVSLASVGCDGIAYALTTSNAAKLTLGGAKMGLGVAATVSKTTDLITATSHGLGTAVPMLYTSSGDDAPPLADGTTYYIIPASANTVYLASSAADAKAGTYIDITDVTVGATAHTFTLTPLAITGTPGFKWQASNDGDKFIDLSVSSVTMSAYTYGGASTGWDLSWYPYRWLRLNVTGPDTGAIYIKSDLSVKK